MFTFALALTVLRVATPLLFASLGGLLSERAGVINIALEGLMLIGAFAGAVAALYFGSPWIAFAAAGAAGMALAALYAFFVIYLRSDQIVVGTAINFLAMGAIPLCSKILYDSTGATPNIPMEMRFAYFPLIFVWFVFLFLWGWIRYSASGLWHGFAGEHPEALDAAGLPVNKIRFISVSLAGLLAGWGGASLSIFLASSYSRNMVAGRGFMALAALIFGKWRPSPTILACLFFAFTDALQMQLQSVRIGGTVIPVQFIQILPYIATILVLSGFVGASRAPKAIGTVFE